MYEPPGLSLKLPRIAIFRAFNLRAEKTDYCKKNPSVFPFDHSILFSPSLTLFLVTFFVSYTVNMSAK